MASRAPGPLARHHPGVGGERRFPSAPISVVLALDWGQTTTGRDTSGKGPPGCAATCSTAPPSQRLSAPMPRITPARAEMRRRQIIEAALICFARHGFHKTTMQDIVKQSALSPGAIYCHFAGKNDIIVAVVEERHRRETQLLRRASGKESFASAIDDLMKN